MVSAPARHVVVAPSMMGRTDMAVLVVDRRLTGNRSVAVPVVILSDRAAYSTARRYCDRGTWDLLVTSDELEVTRP